MLLQGQVTFSETAPDGTRFLFHVAGPGHCFGAAAAASHKPTSVDVTACTRVQALLVPVPQLDRILEASPGFNRAFNELTARRYRTTLRQFAQSRGLTQECYLRTRLSQLAAMWREDGYREAVLELALSQTELANLLGTSATDGEPLPGEARAGGAGGNRLLQHPGAAACTAGA